jgi:Fe-S-cluster containining protein
VNLKTMESRLVPRLYFAGELLDIDGITGASISRRLGRPAGLPVMPWPTLNQSPDLRRKPTHDAKAAAAEVRQVYADLAARPIERSCTRLQECCHFKLTGRTPYLTRGEALVAAKALRATGRKGLPPAENGTCPLLDLRSGNCLIYNDRPFGCRTHFCAAAGGPYARREVADLIQRLEVIDAQLGGDGASALPHAITSSRAAALMLSGFIQSRIGRICRGDHSTMWPDSPVPSFDGIPYPYVRSRRELSMGGGAFRASRCSDTRWCNPSRRGRA